jgi:hypothetical protein
MMGKLASLKVVAHELGAKYNILDSGRPDPVLDSTRAALLSHTRRYTRLEALASDYTSKIDDALSASSRFADALRDAAASHLSDADSAAETDLDGRRQLHDRNAEHAAISDLVSASKTAASVLDALATSGDLRTLLAHYRAFVKESLEVRIEPLVVSTLPRVEKLKAVADYSMSRAERALQRSLASNAALQQLDQQPDAFRNTSSQSPAAFAPALPSSFRSRLRDLSLPASSIAAVPSSSTALTVRQSEADELRRVAEAESAAYIAARDELAANVAQLHTNLVLENARRIEALVHRIDNSLSALSHAAHSRCELPATPPRIGDVLNQDVEDDFDDGSLSFPSLPSTSMDPVAAFDAGSSSASDTMGFANGTGLPAPHVDWFELSDELKLLVSLKYPDTDIVAMFPACDSVSPTVLDRKQLRCMTLNVSSDAAVECSPLGEEADPRLVLNETSLDVMQGDDSLAMLSPCKYQYVVVKGTNFKSLKHVLMDMDKSLVVCQTTGCSFHRGFYDAAYDLHRHVVSKLRRDLPVKLVGRTCHEHFSLMNRFCTPSICPSLSRRLSWLTYSEITFFCLSALQTRWAAPRQAFAP